MGWIHSLASFLTLPTVADFTLPMFSKESLTLQGNLALMEKVKDQHAVTCSPFNPLLPLEEEQGLLLLENLGEDFG